ncbi:MAG: asparagine synthase (glutamine-hydrolyzing) [Bdellovibrionales bacterium]|nr:asparagine synthase (glutamine-hydrolyzing) [Bdellovibrionales bacterium]
MPTHTEVEAMVHAMRERGPDSGAFYSTPGYSAGMRRLAINDLVTGDQPLLNEDETVVLFYNGEIYNAPELRKELQSRGHTFRTLSDGEVICHLYEESGESMLEQLDGMFALALWSASERKLLLGRDIPGEKPLYYAQLSQGGLAFASTIPALLKCSALNTALDYEALWDFPSFLWIPEPRTVYRNVLSLPKSHYLVHDSRGIRLRRYRNLFNTQRLNDSSADGIAAETRRVVSDAVVSRLMSDVPLGAFLSGGLDSSIVASIAARHVPTLRTYTVAFEDVHDPYHGRADESEYAAETASILGTVHRTVRVTAGDFLEQLDSFCIAAGQPFAVSSGLGIKSIARAANDDGLKVLLTGDGADENFGGYSWYPYLDLGKPPARCPQEFITSYQNFGMPLEERLRVIAEYPAAGRAWAWHYYGSEQEKKELFSRDIAEMAKTSLRWFSAYNDSSAWSPRDYIRHDREFYFPNEMLQKCDRMLMAHSIEGRVPFAAPSVLSHSDKLQLSDMIEGDVLKVTLRRAFGDLLPESVIKRPKHGFNVPIDHWLRGEWSHLVDEAFAPSSKLAASGLIQAGSGAYAKRLLSNPGRLSGHTIFSFIVLNRWLELKQ